MALDPHSMHWTLRNITEACLLNDGKIIIKNTHHKSLENDRSYQAQNPEPKSMTILVSEDKIEFRLLTQRDEKLEKLYEKNT